jgi:hypothetical protein
MVSPKRKSVLHEKEIKRNMKESVLAHLNLTINCLKIILGY